MNHRAKKQNGYAAVLTLVLFSALALSILAMFNSGQITTHKLKLQNAVDAASYSAAVVVSRELNFMAYTNRAMIANQVAIGQIVGMVSWLKMMKEASENLQDVGDLVSWIPYVGQLIDAYFTYMEYAVQYTDMAFSDYLAKALIAQANLTINALSLSQQVLHIATQGLIQTTFHGVLQDNDPDAVLAGVVGAAYLADFHGDVYNFSQRTASPTQGSADLAKYDSFADIVKDSRDDFSTQRSYNWIPKITLFPFRMWIAKNGGNEFDRKLQNGKYVWEWSSMDTVSLWSGTWDFTKLKWRDNETLPIGWGAAHLSDESGDYDSYDSEDKWGGAKKNSISAQFAVDDYGDNDLGTVSALDKFYYINDSNKVPVPPSFVAIAGKDSGSVRTWKEIIESNGGTVGGQFNIEELGNLKSGLMYAMSKAEPYYSRAYDLPGFRRDDGLMEYGNLFNPYWQPRLTALTSTEKTTILTTLP